jgi:hypothetical protein
LVLGLLTENGESEVKAYHRLILQDYIEFVHNLSKIAKLFSLDSGDKEGDFLLSIPFFGL